MQTITLELTDSLYQSASWIAEATNRPLDKVVQESLTNTLPPLDDLPVEEASELARMSILSDSELWQTSAKTLSAEQQTTMETLLQAQSAGQLSAGEEQELHTLMDEYGRLLVRKAHAWLLLARRGYRVPMQEEAV